MSSALRSVFIFLSMAVIGLSAGCGGGGGGTGPAAAKMVTGVAATGAPIHGTLITLKDSSPSPSSLTTTTASDGSFAFNTTGLTPPFIIKTSYSNASGLHNLYSLTSEGGITNVTPLTTIIVAQATGSGNLDTFYENHTSAELASAATKVTQAIKDLQTALAPLMEQYGTKGFDVVHGQFDANSTGIDAMMDAITVTVANGAVTIVAAGSAAPIFSASAQNLAGGTLTPVVQPPATPPAALAIYTSKCAGCHGSFASSNLKGRAAVATTQAAITDNLGGMGLLAGISAADLQSIVEALGSTAAQPGPPPVTGGTPALDGAALYAANCADCHGSLAASEKTGTTIVRLQNAISGDVGGMGSISLLTTDEVQAIVAVLNPAGSTPSPVPSPAPTPAPAPVVDGAAEYATSCAACHRPLTTSSKKGMSAARLDTAISGNVGGMGFLSSLTAAVRQAIVAVLAVADPTPVPAPTPVPTPVPVPVPNPSPAPDGAALYSVNCADCHGTLASSDKKGITIARLQNAITNNVGSMGGISLTVSEVQAIVTVLTPSTPTPTPTPGPVPTPTPAPADGAALYTANCAGCHGPLAASGKAGMTAARLSAAINGNVGNMGYLSTLSGAEQQAIATALTAVAPAPAPNPLPTPTPTPAPTPVPVPAPDGAALYSSSCAGCHGALASSGKAGASASRIQSAITGNIGNMGYLSTLSTAQVAAIATALSAVTPAPTPAPTPACGSCHAVPPATGRHSKHSRISCATCHGSGYSTTAVAAAIHANGVKNLTSTIGWTASSRSCANSCHGRETW